MYDENNLTELKCCALNSADMPENFINALPDLERDEKLLIRSMKDVSPNVVINLDSIDYLKTTYNDVYRVFARLANKYQYVFISIDF